MSAAVKVASLTIAIAGEIEVAAGDGAGVGTAAASFGFGVETCLDVAGALAFFALSLERFCAAVVAASASARNKTTGVVRFIKCIFLIGPEVVNLRRDKNSRVSISLSQREREDYCPASFFTVCSVSISSAVLSRRSLTMRGKRKA